MRVDDEIDRIARRTGGLLAYAAVQSVVLAALGLMAGFGLGTNCTNANPGGLGATPCKVIDQGVKFNTALQAFAVVISLAALMRGRRQRARAVAAIAISLAGFVATMTMAGSY